MALRTLILLNLVFMTPLAQSAPTPTTDLPERNAEREALDLERRKLEKQIKHLTQALHSLPAQTMPPATLSARSANTDRSRKRKWIESSLENSLLQLAALEEHQASLHAEEVLSKISKLDNEKGVSGLRKTKGTLCTQAPLQHSSETKLLRSYGPVADPATRVTWQHPGWLLSNSSGSVVACADGVVSFSGPMTGRDWVIILSHQNKQLTLYAHLDPEKVPPFKTGTRVKAGQMLGQTRQRFYFEARSGGQSVNPASVLSSQLIKELNLPLTATNAKPTKPAL